MVGQVRKNRSSDASKAGLFDADATPHYELFWIQQVPIMSYALSWIFVALLLALWSLAAWALHGVAVWTVSSAGAMTGAASGIGSLDWPEWLAPWMPLDMAPLLGSMLAGLGPIIDGMLQWAPALSGGLTVLAWVAWGLGAVLLLALGVGAHVLLALWRRRDGGPGSTPARVASLG
jgi:hypothetical protein